MPGKEHILTILKNAKPSLQKKYGVKNLALFGSYSRDAATKSSSDVDVMVDFSEPIGIEFIDLADELEQLLQLKVDLVSRTAVKQKYFNIIQPELIYV